YRSLGYVSARAAGDARGVTVGPGTGARARRDGNESCPHSFCSPSPASSQPWPRCSRERERERERGGEGGGGGRGGQKE
uniref:Uncharacterized protein n=1 Tax=Aegilops tauschii subsp. strangulata TaxID=200361 RepID=A0A453NYY5_AEGTS